MMLSISNTFHRIFSPEGAVVADVPWKEDDNQGLPDWVFAGEFIEFKVDLVRDKVEWVPAMGPAPCWKARFSSFHDNSTLFKAWDDWAKATY